MTFSYNKIVVNKIWLHAFSFSVNDTGIHGKKMLLTGVKPISLFYSIGLKHSIFLSQNTGS